MYLESMPYTSFRIQDPTRNAAINAAPLPWWQDWYDVCTHFALKHTRDPGPEVNSRAKDQSWTVCLEKPSSHIK